MFLKRFGGQLDIDFKCISQNRNGSGDSSGIKNRKILSGSTYHSRSIRVIQSKALSITVFCGRRAWTRHNLMHVLYQYNNLQICVRVSFCPKSLRLVERWTCLATWLSNFENFNVLLIGEVIL